MNIEHMIGAVEIVLDRRIDPTAWDWFARGGYWECAVIELLAQLYQDAEPEINQTLAEIDADETEAPTSTRVPGVSDVGGTDTNDDNERI